jgi:hypothetical protein
MESQIRLNGVLFGGLGAQFRVVCNFSVMLE